MIVKNEPKVGRAPLFWELQGKSRKLVNNKASERESCSAATLDGRVVLRIVKQPESQHRARYLTEGSRGSVKDRIGTGFPTVKLEGCAVPVRLQIYVGSERCGEPTPHLFYQVSRVAGKGAPGCQETRSGGTNYLEISADTRHGNLYICDCIGILKERYSDVEGRFPNDSAWKEAKRKSTQCRLVFRLTVDSGSGNLETLQVASHLINCCQPPGSPEMLKLNTLSSPMRGGGELWIIGKNFLKDTKVSFSFIKPGAEEPAWTKIVSPVKEYFHQNHLIVLIPPLFDHLHYDVQVHVSILSSGKRSDPVGFTYKADLAAISVSHPSDRRKGKISVIKSTKSLSPPGRPTILEPLDHSHHSHHGHHGHHGHHSHHSHHEKKRARVDQWGPGRRGQRSNLSLTTRSSSGESSAEENSSWQPAPEEPTIFPSNGEFSSNLTMDFSNFFKQKRNEMEVEMEVVKQVSGEQNNTGLADLNTWSQELSEPPCRPEANISYEKTREEKATISISLPSSIFKDEKHLQNIMETINTTILRPEEEERYQRKRLYDEDKVEVEVEGEMGKVVEVVDVGDWREWKTEELKSAADKKWTADINEILETVQFVNSSPSDSSQPGSVSVQSGEAQPPPDLQDLIEQAQSDTFHLG